MIAMRNHEAGLSHEFADVPSIIAEIIRDHVPNLSAIEIENIITNEQESFRAFDVRDSIASALRGMHPDIQEEEVSRIFEAVRKRFSDPELEHAYFLFFVISRIIELRNLSISRGAYLLEIARGQIPRPSKLVRFFQMWRHLVRYKMAKK